METNNINTPKNSYLLPASVLIAAVLIAGSVIYSAGKDNAANKDLGDQQANAAKTFEGDPLKLTSEDAVKGNANAPVTIIVYSDPSCPFCAAAAGSDVLVKLLKPRFGNDWEPAVPNIVKNYVDTGKAKIAFRYFPGHGTGEEIMKLMFCTNDQGKFWEVHDKIFDGWKAGSDGNPYLPTIDEAKKLIAGTVDMNKVNECLASGKYDSKIENDTKSGTAAGVDGTPAFFINGKLITGAQPYSEFQKVIDELLKK